MIEYRAGPCGGGVAGGAGGRESGSDVVGIRGARVIGLVTGVAVSRSTCKLVADVARCAWNRYVRAGERERSVVVIEHCPGPRGRRMAGGAGGGESGGDVVGVRGASVIGLVAGVAIGWRSCEHVIDVA